MPSALCALRLLQRTAHARRPLGATPALGRTLPTSCPPQPWFQRDTPVGLDLLFENFLDPVRGGPAVLVTRAATTRRRAVRRALQPAPAEGWAGGPPRTAAPVGAPACRDRARLPLPGPSAPPHPLGARAVQPPRRHRQPRDRHAHGDGA